MKFVRRAFNLWRFGSSLVGQEGQNFRGTEPLRCYEMAPQLARKSTGDVMPPYWSKYRTKSTDCYCFLTEARRFT